MPFLFFIAYIIIEIALFASLGGLIGALLTVFFVIIGFFLGGMMIARGGAASRQWLRGVLAGEEAGDVGVQAYWYIGGLLVMLPGFLTDLFGLAVIIPPTRALLLWLLGALVPPGLKEGVTIISNVAEKAGRARSADGGKGPIIEGEIVQDDDAALGGSDHDRR